MKLDYKPFSVFAASLMAIAFGTAAPARAAADASGINFDLHSNASRSESSSSAAATATETPAQRTEAEAAGSNATDQPLDIPPQASTVPVGSSGQSQSIADLPPPPEVKASVEPAPVSASVEESVEERDAEAVTAERPRVTPRSPQPSQSRQPSSQRPKPSSRSLDSGILNFSPDAIATSAPSTAPQPAPAPAQLAVAPAASINQSSDLDPLFSGGTNSLVARAVGSAEGTRTPDGGRTWAYRGHVDPGNGVWNLGTFSYQHGARSPEEADTKQMQRLRGQAQTLQDKAQARGIQMTLEEALNGIDLANQSPRAALSRGGYIDRLQQAHQMGLSGSDAVLWARTRSYLDPDTSRWNAPGLGNNVHSITSDQQRRMTAIARAIAAQPLPSTRASLDTQPDSRRRIANAASTELRSQRDEASNTPPDSPSIVDQILSLDLPPG